MADEDDLMTAQVVAVIAGYRPRMPEAAAILARSTVAAVAPPTVARAKALLWACARLATFGISVGLDPSPAVLLHPSVIERFVIVGTAELSGAAPRTLRTNLRHVAARMGPAGPARWRCAGSGPRRPTRTPRSPAIWRWPTTRRPSPGGCGPRG